MAFVVEDGSGNPLSNAYLAVADFKTHHDDRGRSYAAFTDTQIQQGIVKATDYVDKRFGKQFRGVRRSHDQGLEWPRLSAYDNDGFLLQGSDEVPRLLAKAIAEYALIVLQLLNQELLPIPARPFAVLDPATETVSGGQAGQVIRNREKVGPLETEQWYSDMSRFTNGSAMGVRSSIIDDLNIPDYPRADLWLEELIRPSMNITLLRGD